MPATAMMPTLELEPVRPTVYRDRLADLVTALDALCADDAPIDVCLSSLHQALSRHAPRAEACLSAAQLDGSPDCYVRHVLYADPQDRYTVVALVWRAGQRTPVHGHQTWCGYAVLRGHLIEEQFSHDAAGSGTQRLTATSLPQGYVSAVAAGLDSPHRISHGGGPAAVSLHVYGVASRDIRTAVNHVVPFD